MVAFSPAVPRVVLEIDVMETPPCSKYTHQWVLQETIALAVHRAEEFTQLWAHSSLFSIQLRPHLPKLAHQIDVRFGQKEACDNAEDVRADKGCCRWYEA